jgi:hypothetical protein
VFTTTEAHNDSSAFELRNGFVIISATLDGDTGHYILDSGAPGLVLNSRRFDLNGTSVELAGVGGSMTGKEVSGHNFTWKSVELDGIDAITIDLGYLEDAVGLDIAGLIGMDVFKGHDILIDYASRHVFIGDHECCSQADVDGFVKLPIVKNDHILTVKMSYRGSELLFGIDTGSKSNLLSKAAAGQIFPEDYRNLGKIKLIGADQRETMTEEWLISAFRASGIPIDPVPYVIQDMTGIDKVQKLGLDGILGHEFFRDSKILISKDRKSLYVKSNAFPLYVQH